MLTPSSFHYRLFLLHPSLSLNFFQYSFYLSLLTPSPMPFKSPFSIPFVACRPLRTLLLCSISLLCTALHCTVLYYTLLYYAALYCTVLYYTALCCTVLHCTALHCTALYYTILHLTTLHSTALLYFTALYLAKIHCSALQCILKFRLLLCFTSVGRLGLDTCGEAVLMVRSTAEMKTLSKRLISAPIDPLTR
jgi:hypothetical protein